KPLSTSARAYVTGITIAGAALFAACLPLVRFDQPILFAVLLVLSSATATLKVQLPLLTSSSTMSVSYAVDFASLLLLGPHATMLIAAASALSQCHLNTRTRTPMHRTLFSMASLVLAVEGAGLGFRLLGGGPLGGFVALAQPLVGAATLYFLINTSLVAAAIALSTDDSIIATWRRNFLWRA